MGLRPLRPGELFVLVKKTGLQPPSGRTIPAFLIESNPIRYQTCFLESNTIALLLEIRQLDYEHEPLAHILVEGKTYFIAIKYLVAIREEEELQNKEKVWHSV